MPRGSTASAVDGNLGQKFGHAGGDADGPARARRGEGRVEEGADATPCPYTSKPRPKPSAPTPEVVGPVARMTSTTVVARRS